MRNIAQRSTAQLIWSLTHAKDRIRIGLSVLLIIIGSLLEVVSLGLVIPTVGSIVEGDPRQETTILPAWVQSMSFYNFVRLLMLVLVFSFVVKNIFIIVSSYYQQRAQMALSNRLVQSLFETYIRQPYEFHLTHSSSLLLRNIQEYATAVVSQGVAPALVLLAEVLTAVGYITVLLIVDPVSTTLLLLCFGLSTIAINRLTRKKIRLWGEQRIEQRRQLTEAILTGLGAIREIKVFGRDLEFMEWHRRSLYAAGRYVYRFGFIQSLPRAIFEILTVGGVAIVVILQASGDRSLRSATVTIALFGVAAFRLLPAVNRVTSTLQLLSFGRAGIVGAVESFEINKSGLPDDCRRHHLKFQALHFERLEYQYPGASRPAVMVDELKIGIGESVGIIGPSGCGKSTLVDVMIGLLGPTKGRVVVNGVDLVDVSRDWKDVIGYVPQSVYLMDDSIRRNVAFGVKESEIDDVRVRDCLLSANLWNFVSESAAGLETRIGERGIRMSGGQRQRLGLARALYGSPQVLVLDEATSALDEDTEHQIVEALKTLSKQLTIIVIAHRVTTLKYCSRILKMEHGRVVGDGTYAELVGSLTARRGQ